MQEEQQPAQPEKPKKKIYKQRWLWILVSIVMGIVLGYNTSLIVWGQAENVGSYYQRNMGLPFKVGYFSYLLKANDTRSKCNTYEATSPGPPMEHPEECINTFEYPHFLVLNFLIWIIVLYTLLYFLLLRNKNTIPR